GRGLRFFGSGTRGDVGFVRKIICAEDNEAGFGQAYAVRKLAADEDGRTQVSGQITGLVIDSLAARMLDAAAETVRNFVLAQQTGETLYFALVGSDEQHACFLLHERADLLNECRNRSVEAQCGT